jgi:hypothetical protein
MTQIDSLISGHAMVENECIRSSSGRFFARLEENGNFNLYETNNFVPENLVWSSQTSNENLSTPFEIFVTNEGKIVIYDGLGQESQIPGNFSSGTSPFRLVVENNRDMVLYDTYNKVIWNSKTTQYSFETIDDDLNFVSGLLNVCEDTLGHDKCLPQNSYLVSMNKKYYARLEEDGNFVIYKGNNFTQENAVWCSFTKGQGKGPYSLRMLKNGNLILYDGNKQPLWASNTFMGGKAPFRLVIENNMNLVIYDTKNNSIWSSETSIPISDFLSAPEYLDENEYIVSKNGKYYARVQSDGNFVCYESNEFIPSNAFWSSKTWNVGKGPFKLYCQNDGNLCLYDSSDSCTWSSGTWRKGVSPHRLVMQDDRNLVLLDSKYNVQWKSNTDLN